MTNIDLQIILLEVLAIRHIFSLVGHDNKHEFFMLPKCLLNLRIMKVKYNHLILKYVSKPFYITILAETPKFYIFILSNDLIN